METILITVDKNSLPENVLDEDSKELESIELEIHGTYTKTNGEANFEVRLVFLGQNEIDSFLDEDTLKELGRKVIEQNY